MEAQELDDLFAPSAAAATAVADTVAAVAWQYLNLRREKEDAERQLKEINESLATAEWQLLAKMDEHGLKSVKVVDNHGRHAHISAAATTSYRLRVDDLDSVRAWIIEHGGSSLIKDTVPWQSFESFCRELADQGEAIPATVRVTSRRVVRLKRE
mgnify:CR=1 FL=1